jgi:nicotinamidase-related amidase
MKQDIRLLVVDPQNDFCDLPQGSWRDGVAPALPVAGAHADMARLAHAISRSGAGLSAIAITQDTHAAWDIAHPTFWRTAEGGEVAPFTPVTRADLAAGRYMPKNTAHRARAEAYLQALEARGRYTLMIWPVHCVDGSWGHALHAEVDAACAAWQGAAGGAVMTVRKGMNPWTEHYSAVRAEVPEGDDPATQTNADLLAWALAADILVVAGEAGSHCVRATTEDIVQAWPGGRADKLLLLQDAMSPVAGFDAAQSAFFEDMAARGARFTDTAGFAALCQSNARFPA